MFSILLSVCLFVLNSVSVTCAFVASLICQNNIIFLPGVSIFLFKKKGAGGIVPVFFVLLISPLFVYSIPVGLFLLPEMLYSAWYLHQRYFNNSNSQSSEAYF